MKQLLFISCFLILAATASQAQEKEAEKISLETVQGMIASIKVEDFTTKPCKWGFSYIADNEDHMKMFVRTLGNKEKRSFSYVSKDGEFFCSIDEEQVFTAESLYNLIRSRDEVAASCHMAGVRAFGLKNPVR